VTHGCRAGRYQEAFQDIYMKRIQRGNEYFDLYKLGAYGADLAALSGFFHSTWSKPVTDLTEIDKSLILSIAGFDLRPLGWLKEAAQPMKSSFEVAIEQEDWENAARDAGNLSELHLTMGGIAQALDQAKRSIELADQSGDAFQQMVTRTTLADALYQTGSFDKSEHLFKEAEEMQKKSQPQYTFLYSLQGFRYCDLLLGRGKYTDVLSRAEQTLEWFKQEYPLYSIALDHLSLGRAHLLQTLHEGTGDLSQASEHLNKAVDWLRRAGVQDYILRSLLARAELYIAQKEFEKAQCDLDEAMTIAERGEMGLHKADCRLGYARLYLAMGNKEKARGELAIAKEMIRKMGYHRRDGEVKELEALCQDSG